MDELEKQASEISTSVESCRMSCTPQGWISWHSLGYKRLLQGVWGQAQSTVDFDDEGHSTYCAAGHFTLLVSSYAGRITQCCQA